MPDPNSELVYIIHITVSQINDAICANNLDFVSDLIIDQLRPILKGPVELGSTQVANKIFITLDPNA